MKKVSKKFTYRIIKINQRKRKKCTKEAKRRKHLRYISLLNKHKNSYIKILDIRKELIHSLYAKRSYRDKRQVINIVGQFGIEEQSIVENFLKISTQFVDSRSRFLLFNFENCTRVWPSAITLLCSLKQWVELTAYTSKPPRLASTSSKSNEVNAYLAHCGFYDYVKRENDGEEEHFNNKAVVKIQRETNVKNIEEREDEIVELLNRYSAFNKDEVEEFNDIILTEIFNNVTEHGISNKDKGWWLLAQYHKTHKIISLCVADNGIGIRNSLMTGPQRLEISKKIEDLAINDGRFIKLACEENISGAVSAPLKSGFILKRYESGARRGNGLNRIICTCKKLSVQISILSHNGFLFYDYHGREKLIGSRENRVFAGTMYHLTIVAK